MYTAQPQTLVILLSLGDVSPQKYLYICWDFQMSQMESSSNPVRKVIPSLSYQLAFHKLGSSQPSRIAVFERGLEMSAEKHLCIFNFLEKESLWLSVRDLRSKWPVCLETWVHSALPPPTSLPGNGRFLLGFFWYFVVRSVLGRKEWSQYQQFLPGFSAPSPGQPHQPFQWFRPKNICQNTTCAAKTCFSLPRVRGDSLSCATIWCLSSRECKELWNTLLANRRSLNTPIIWGLCVSKSILQLQWVGQTCCCLHVGSETHSPVSCLFPKPICLA